MRGGHDECVATLTKSNGVAGNPSAADLELAQSLVNGGEQIFGVYRPSAEDAWKASANVCCIFQAPCFWPHAFAIAPLLGGCMYLQKEAHVKTLYVITDRRIIRQNTNSIACDVKGCVTCPMSSDIAHDFPYTTKAAQFPTICILRPDDYKAHGVLISGVQPDFAHRASALDPAPLPLSLCTAAR